MRERARRPEPDEDRPRRPAPAPAAPEPRALLALQRGAGNAAVARMVQAGGRTLARVGEKKVGVMEDKDSDPGAVEVVRGALKRIAATHRQAKDTFEQTTLRGMPTGKDEAAAKTRQKTVMNDYPALLDGGDRVALLERDSEFVAAKLKIGVKTDTSATVLDEGGKVVAKLVLGRANFVPAPKTPKAPEVEAEGAEDEAETAPERELFTRIGKEGSEYVQDDLGAETRRYAYCEKSFYQFMELVATGTMTGRFQTWHKALSESADLYSIAPHLGRQLSPKGKAMSTMDKSQMAVLHQWKGSGPEQRGLSLASTPRPEAVYGNAGDSFKSADGVRIKIDLSLVPKSVVLVNHYSEGGAGERADVNPSVKDFRAKGYGKAKYSYLASARKNRELFLERLDPEWIVGLTYHGSKDVLPKEDAGKTGKELVDAVGKQAGAGDYADAFNQTIAALGKGEPVPDAKGATDAFVKGVASGQTYWKGRAAGATEFERYRKLAEQYYGKLVSRKAAEETLDALNGKAAPVPGGKPSLGLTPPADDGIDRWAMTAAAQAKKTHPSVRDWTPDGWSVMTTLSPKRTDEYDLYWIGWAHAAKHKPPQPMGPGFHEGRPPVTS